MMTAELAFIIVMIVATIGALWIGWQLGNVTRRIWEAHSKRKNE